MEENHSETTVRKLLYLPFEFVHNKLVYFDRKSNSIIQKEDPIEEEITHTMLSRITHGFTITNYGGDIYQGPSDTPIVDIWGWFKKIRKRIDQQNKEKDSSSQQQDTLEIKALFNFRKAIEEESQREFREFNFFYFCGMKILKYEKMDTMFNLLDWTNVDLGITIDHLYDQKWGHLSKKGALYRDAAIWCLHLQFSKAIEILKNYLNTSDDVSELTLMINFLESFSDLITEARQSQNLSSYIQAKPIDPDDETCSLRTDVIKFQTKLEFMRSQITKFTFKNPYLQLIKNFMTNDYDIMEILKDSRIAINDRLAFLLRFQTSKISDVCSELEKHAFDTASIEFIVLFGDSELSFLLIQQYIDKTSDIQTAAMIGYLLTGLNIFPDKRELNLIYREYIDFLNFHQLFYHRAKIDKETTEIKEKTAHFKSTINQSELSQLSCYYCKANLAHGMIIKSLNPYHKSFKTIQEEKRQYITYCPNCSKTLPNCSVCLRPFLLLNPAIDLHRKYQKKTKLKAMNYVNSFDKYRSMVWCQNCKHGGHAKHLADWFLKSSVCPVTDCSCQCNNL